MDLHAMATLELRGAARRIGEGEGPLAGRCTLEVGDQTRRHARDVRCALIGPDGARSIVEVAGASVLGERARRGAFASLAAEPGVAELDDPPGPHVLVDLCSA